MTDPTRLSPFIEPAAVEAWDAWFRWRHHAHLCDVSIDDTWRRVAGALAAVESEDGRALWFGRFLDVLATWQLLPDERLLAAAGTGPTPWHGETLDAVLNLAAFVATDRDDTKRIDPVDVAQVAEVAVRMLDNAALLAGVTAPRLRIGLTGVADALALLGCGYDDDAGRVLVAAWARALAEGSFAASAELALERGATGGAIPAIERAILRGFAPDVVRAAHHHGLRHRRLTAIVPHPRLALLANDVADALDPLQDAPHPRTIIAAPGDGRTMYSSGCALNVLQAGGSRAHAAPATLAALPWSAQIRMRAAVQPWMDEPIAYHLLFTAEPDAQQVVEMSQQAAVLGLAAPTWRIVAGGERAAS